TRRARGPLRSPVLLRREGRQRPPALGDRLRRKGARPRDPPAWLQLPEPPRARGRRDLPPAGPRAGRAHRRDQLRADGRAELLRSRLTKISGPVDIVSRGAAFAISSGSSRTDILQPATQN